MSFFYLDEPIDGPFILRCRARGTSGIPSASTTDLAWYWIYTGSTGGMAKINIEFMDVADTASLGGVSSGWLTPPSSWTLASISSSIPAGCGYLRVWINVTGGGSPSDFGFDDFVLQVDGSTVATFDAESGDTSGWTDTLGTLDVTTTSPHAGTYSYNNGGFDSIQSYQDVAVSPTASSGGGFSMGVMPTDPSGLAANTGDVSNLLASISMDGSDVYLGQNYVLGAGLGVTPANDLLFEISYNGADFDYYVDNSFKGTWAYDHADGDEFWAGFDLGTAGIEAYDIRWYRGDDADPTVAATPFRFYGSFDGHPGASQELFNVEMNGDETFEAGLPSNKGKCKVAPTSSVTFPIKKNGVQVGTMNIASGATTATWTMASDLTFAAGDTFSFYGPATANAALSGISYTFVGTVSA